MEKNKILEYLKRNLFWLIVILLLVIIIILDLTKIQDACLMFYGIEWAMFMICGILFWSYLRKRQGASKIYWWLTVLLFAGAIDRGIMFTARYFYIHRGAVYTVLINSFWWKYRSVFVTLALFYLLWFALKQRYGKGGTYYDHMQQEMEIGFENLEAKIIEGEVKFSGHSHSGLALEAKIILQVPKANNKIVTETTTTTTTTTGEPK